MEIPGTITDVQLGAAVCDVAWSPTEHLVALSCFGGDHPLLMYAWERQVRRYEGTKVRRYEKGQDRTGQGRTGQGRKGQKMKRSREKEKNANHEIDTAP